VDGEASIAVVTADQVFDFAPSLDLGRVNFPTLMSVLICLNVANACSSLHAQKEVS
jgi:hypothetical protein